MNWRFALTLLLLVGAMVTGWSVWRQQDTLVEPATTSGRSDYVLHDYEIISLDDNGKESFTLLGPLLFETPGKQTLQMRTPLFLIPNAQGKHWTLQAQRGWVSADRKQIRLAGDVRAIGPRTQAQPTRILTRQLDIRPEDKRATSPAAVTIRQPGSILRGVGLDANLADKQYTLQSQVRSRYVRTSR